MGLIPNEVTTAIMVVLIIVLVVWTWNFYELKDVYNKLKAEAIEECYYWKCQARLFGDITCEKIEMPRFNPNISWGVNIGNG